MSEINLKMTSTYELNRKSVHIEKWYDALVEKLKDKICGVIIINQEEECLEVEDIRKEIDDKFVLHIRDG